MAREITRPGCTHAEGVLKKQAARGQGLEYQRSGAGQTRNEVKPSWPKKCSPWRPWPWPPKFLTSCSGSLPRPPCHHNAIPPHAGSRPVTPLIDQSADTGPTMATTVDAQQAKTSGGAGVQAVWGAAATPFESARSARALECVRRMPWPPLAVWMSSQVIGGGCAIVHGSTPRSLSAAHPPSSLDERAHPPTPPIPLAIGTANGLRARGGCYLTSHLPCDCDAAHNRCPIGSRLGAC